jgi:heme exporter protein D
MGGYAWYVWGSMGMTAVLLLLKWCKRVSRIAAYWRWRVLSTAWRSHES